MREKRNFVLLFGDNCLENAVAQDAVERHGVDLGEFSQINDDTQALPMLSELGSMVVLARGGNEIRSYLIQHSEVNDRELEIASP